MNIKYHRQFLKHFRKRIPPHSKLDAKFKERLGLWIANPKNPVLGDHRLAGKKRDFRSFSITGDVRMVYKIDDDTVWFYDIGSHNQVY